jgi:hypothetical protein
MGWEKILDIISWAKDKLPIPNRVEGIKNEIDKLETERSAILVKKWEVKMARRLEYIDGRLLFLRRRVQNIAGDK